MNLGRNLWAELVRQSKERDFQLAHLIEETEVKLQARIGWTEHQVSYLGCFETGE